MRGVRLHVHTGLITHLRCIRCALHCTPRTVLITLWWERGCFLLALTSMGYITADNFICQVRISWRENCELDPFVVLNPFLLDCPVEHPFVSLIHKCQMILLIKWESFGKKRLLTTVQYGFGLFVVLNWPSFSRLP